MGYVISIILLIIFIIFFIVIRNKYTKNLQNLTKITIKDLTEQQLAEIQKEYNELESYYNKEKIRLEEEYKTTTEKIFVFNENLNRLKEDSKKEIDRDLLLYKKQQTEIMQLELKNKFDKLRLDLQKELDNSKKLVSEQQEGWIRERLEEKEKLQKQMELLKEEIADYERKREVINKQILMERELKEKADFYKINVSDYDIQDLKLISQIEQNFHNKEVLNRAVFDTFIKKPMNEMIKRVLEGRTPSGIYMITNTLTNEIYIGRAVSVDKRWQEHCKSCFNIGTIAHSTLHTRMAKEGIWNFSFQLLEEVPKENLSEREKYWINFYKTKEYGMNERQGG